MSGLRALAVMYDVYIGRLVCAPSLSLIQIITVLKILVFKDTHSACLYLHNSAEQAGNDGAEQSTKERDGDGIAELLDP